MRNILVKISYFIHSCYKWILAAALIISVLSLFLISDMQMKTDLMDVMPAGDPSMKLFSETLDDLQKINALTIVIGSGEPDIEKYVEIIEAIGQRLGGSPLIRAVDYSVFNMPWKFMFRHFPLYLDEEGVELLRERMSSGGIRRQIRRNYHDLASPFSTPADIKMITGDPLDIRSIMRSSAVRGGVPGIDVSSGYYISGDRASAFIFATPAGSSRDISFVNALKKEMKDIVRRTLKEHGSPDIDVGFTGGYAISWEAQESIRHDMLFSALMTVFLVLVIFRFVYKSTLGAIALIFMTIAVSLLLTLTGAYILFGSLNLVTALVSAMLIGLGIDYALHIYDRYVMELKRTGETRKALELTLSNTGRSIVTSGITTAFAFSSIVLTSFRGLHELGIIAGIGIISCLISTIFILGSFLVLIGSGRFSGVLVQKENRFLEKSAPDFIMRHGRLFLIIMGAALLCSAAGIGKIGFVSDISRIGLNNSRAVELQERMSEKIGDRGMPLFVTYTGNARMEKVIDDMETKLDAWKEGGATGGHNSLGGILPPPYRQRSVIGKLPSIYDAGHDIEKSFTEALAKYGFHAGESELSYIRSVIGALRADKTISLDELPERIRAKAGLFYNADKKRLSAYIYPPGPEWERADIDVIEKDLNALGDGWALTGWPLLSAGLRDSIIKESVTAALISFVFILVMIYVHFRRAAIIFFVQMPLVFGLLLTLGIMGFSGTGFNYINIAAITLIFGISVDYGVYIMQALSENGGRDNNGIIRHAFKNIVICSLTTTAGFGSLVTTSFRGISSLGLVIIIGILSCLMISVSLLPLYERMLAGRK